MTRRKNQDFSTNQKKETKMTDDTKKFEEKVNISYGEKQLFASPLMAAVNIKAAIKKFEAERQNKSS